MPAESDPYPIVCRPARGRNGELGERDRRVGSEDSPTVMCCDRKGHREDGEGKTGEGRISNGAGAGLGARHLVRSRRPRRGLLSTIAQHSTPD